MIAAAILFSFAIFNIKEIVRFFKMLVYVLQPVLIGIVIAYLLNPIVNFMERKGTAAVQKFKWKKVTQNQIRMISVGVTEILAIVVILGIGSVLMPELANSLGTFISALPGYINKIAELLEKLTKNSDSQWVAFIENLLNDGSREISSWINAGVLQNLENFLSYFTTGVIGIAKILLNIMIGVIISVYLLVSKQKFVGQGKKVLYALFYERQANNILKVVRKSHSIFSGFISGKLIDSLIIGVLCFVGMTIMKMPYIPLVSVIVGVTNVIPFFGPYLGAIPVFC